MDELKLYPGAEAVPTELADKILPVFQINSQDVNVQVTPSNVVRYAEHAGNNQSDVLFTVATGKKFYLTGATLNIQGANSADDQDRVHIAVIIDGTSQIAFAIVTDNVATHEANGQISFPNPIECDSESEIILVTTNGRGGTSSIHAGSIIGYQQ